MRTQRTTLSVSVLALLALAACGTESGPGSAKGSGDGGDAVQSDVPVTGVAWRVDSVTVGGKKTEAPEGSRLEIDPKGRAKAHFGCNHISVDARVKGDRITLGKPVTTQMACGEDVEKFEKAAIDAMGGEHTAKLSGEKLTLTTEGGDTMALSEEKPADLVGTRWTVTTLLSGQTATTVAGGSAEGADAVSDLLRGRRRAGSLRLQLLPREGDGQGRHDHVRAGGKHPQDVPEQEMAVERAVLAALKGSTTYTIKGSTLTVTAEGGKGIGATAASPGAGNSSQHG